MLECLCYIRAGVRRLSPGFGSMLLATILCGCTVGPRYQPPKYTSAPAFGELGAPVNTNEPVADWWREFHDPELDRLIDGVLRSNIDLQIAAARIRESRSQRNIAAADLFPQVDADSSYARSLGSKNVVLPLGGSSGSGGGSPKMVSRATPRAESESGGSSAGGGSLGANPLGSPPSPFGKGGLPGATTDLYQVGFDASWEIDVFGGKRRAVEAATAAAAAVAESRHALQVSLVAETARDYLELRGAQERLRIARDNLAAQNDVLTLTRSKQSVGLDTDLDVARAASEVAATESSLAPLEADARKLVHALSTLAGREPNELVPELAEAKPVPAEPPEVPVGLPSQLLKRRADIREAERQIAEANARIGVAKADLFPKFALIGSAGLDSSSAANLFNWESKYFLISPTVAWRIFDAGRIMANIHLQEANKQEAALQYRGAILKALREVEDALTGYASERVRRNHLSEELRQDQRVLELARQRYDKGLADFLIVLDAERNVLASQDAMARSEVSVATELVALYKSLGGGWK